MEPVRLCCQPWQQVVPLLGVVLLLLILTACERSGLNSDLAFHRGMNAMAEGRLQWARFYFAQDLTANPDRQQSMRQLGLAWDTPPQPVLSNAIRQYREYLARQPAADDIREKYIQALFLAGEWEESRRQLAYLPRGLRADLLSADLLLAEDTTAAAAIIHRVLQQAPDSIQAHAMAARLFADSGKTQQAILHARQAIKLGSLEPRLHYLLAQLMRAQGDITAARQLLATQQLLRQLQQDTLTARLQPLQKLELLNTLESRLPTPNRNLRILKLPVLLQTGKLQQARAELSAFDNGLALAVPTRLNIAALAARAGQYQLAGTLYQSIPATHPEHAEALLGLAWLAYRTDKLDRAMQWARSGLEQAPQQARLHHILALIRLRLEDSAGAAGRLETALNFAPWHAPWRILLADIYLDRGQPEKAAALLQDAPEELPLLQNYRRRHGLP